MHKKIGGLIEFAHQYIGQYIAQNVFKFEHDKDSGESAVSSEYAPVLDEGSVQRIRNACAIVENLNEYQILEQVLGAYLAATSQLAIRDLSTMAPQLSLGLSGAMARYEAYGILAQSAGKEVASRFANARIAFDQLTERQAVATQEYETRLSDLGRRGEEVLLSVQTATERHSDLTRQIDNLDKQIEAKRVEFDKKYENSEQQAQAFMASLKAASDNRDLKLYWTDRAWWAACGMWVSWIVLAVLLVVVPAFMLVNYGETAKFLKDLSAAFVGPDSSTNAATLTVATISRLVVVTIPVALYFWLIRLVVRYNMRSMLLMDDARQRATMLDTFYKMIERRVASVEDRALVLTALMRPAPGHGPDSVEPPNFTEVLDKMKGIG